MTGHIHEECGVFGIFAPEKQAVASTAYYALFALQHRGQESAGIVVNDDGVFKTHKDVGLVNDVFFLRIFPDRGNQFGIDTVFPMDILQELLTEFFSGEPDRDVRGCEAGLTVACEDGGSQLIHINE